LSLTLSLKDYGINYVTKELQLINSMNKFINSYFFELFEHHKKILKVYDRVLPSQVNYLKESTQIFHLINLASQMDKDFNDEFIQLCQKDIMQLEHMIYSLSNDEKLLEIIFHHFQNKYPDYNVADYTKITFYERVAEEFKLYIRNFRVILNTKFSYLDYYVYHKITKSNRIKYLFEEQEIPMQGSVLDLLPKLISDKINMKIDYSSVMYSTVEGNSQVKYKAKDMIFVKSIMTNYGKYDYNNPLEQIIKGKHHIPYFSGMTDSDIRQLVKDVRFKKYKTGEVVISEAINKSDKNINMKKDNHTFFLLEGECEVSLENKTLSTISQKTIFGEFSFIGGEPRSATVKTTKDCVIISFDFDLDLFDNAPVLFSQLYKNTSENLVKKFYELNNTLAKMSSETN